MWACAVHAIRGFSTAACSQVAGRQHCRYVPCTAGQAVQQVPSDRPQADQVRGDLRPAVAPRLTLRGVGHMRDAWKVKLTLEFDGRQCNSSIWQAAA